MCDKNDVIQDAKSRMEESLWNGAKWIRRDKRLAIYIRDDFECVYCGTTHNLTLDHLKPRIRGGDNTAKNLVTACKSCNSARGDRPWWQFASDESQKRIKRNRRRSIKSRRKLAKEMLDHYDSWQDIIREIKVNGSA